MPTPTRVADKTLTTILGISVAINSFFLQRTFTVMDKIAERQAVADTAIAIGSKVDDYQDQRLTKDNDRLLALESWYSKVKKKKETL